MASELVTGLRKLAELHESGVLSDAQFVAAKESLLSRHGGGVGEQAAPAKDDPVPPVPASSSAEEDQQEPWPPGTPPPAPLPLDPTNRATGDQQQKSPPPAPPSTRDGGPTGPSASSGIQEAPPDPDTADDRYLWAIVAVPVLAGLIEMVAGFNPGLSTLLVVAAIGANTGLAILDIRDNQKLAEDDSTGGLVTAAALLMPFYVHKRQRILGRSLLPFWTYLVAVGFIVALQFSTGATNYIVSDLVESEKGSWGRSTFGVPVDVDCPEDQPARAGHRFVCSMSDGVDRVGVRVEVLNSSGDIEWEVVG